jgi:hypothetical protein
MHMVHSRSLTKNGANAERALLTLAAEELLLVSAAMQAVLREIEPPEFETRLGETVDTARDVLAELLATAIEAKGQPEVEIAVSVAELRLMKNALNEVLNGLGVEELISHFGSDRIASLLKSLGASLRDVGIVAEVGGMSREA